MNTNICSRCDTENTSNARFCSGCGYQLERNIKETVETLAPASQKTKLAAISRVLKPALGVVLGLIIAYTVQYFLFKSPPIDKIMMETASELNKSCPIMVDAETRLDNALAMPQNTFQYNYTLVNWVKDSIDLPALEEYIKPNIVNNAKTNPQMKVMRDNNVILNYYYKDKDGVFLFNITVKPADYK